jgi:hypothetical protein
LTRATGDGITLAGGRPAPEEPTMKKKKRKRIAVEAMADMTRYEVSFTNRVANILLNRHRMCLDCAIKMSVAFVKGQRPEHEHNPVTAKLCSNVCARPMCEFYEETLGVRGERVSVDDLPPRAQ